MNTFSHSPIFDDLRPLPRVLVESGGHSPVGGSGVDRGPIELASAGRLSGPGLYLTDMNNKRKAAT